MKQEASCARCMYLVAPFTLPKPAPAYEHGGEERERKTRRKGGEKGSTENTEREKEGREIVSPA